MPKACNYYKGDRVTNSFKPRRGGISIQIIVFRTLVVLRPNEKKYPCQVETPDNTGKRAITYNLKAYRSDQLMQTLFSKAVLFSPCHQVVRP